VGREAQARGYIRCRLLQQRILSFRSFRLKTVVAVVLAVLCAFGAAILYWAPVRRYAVSCERTADLACGCVLEQTGASGTRRTFVPLPAGAAAVVRILPRRRGASRVILELQTPGESVFAAEFEGADADSAADAAAAQLNTVLRARNAPALARITAAPPPVYRIAAWSGLGVMGLIIFALVRAGALPERAAPEVSKTGRPAAAGES
jgi:hypothetical protein